MPVRILSVIKLALASVLVVLPGHKTKVEVNSVAAATRDVPDADSDKLAIVEV
jgi:hypothetical protein